MSDIQSISIISTQTVTQPKPHTTYTIQITTPMRSWTVSRRYNDFLSLHSELLSSTEKEPPASLPQKHPWSLTRAAYDQKVIRERKVLLEAYLRALLNHRNPIWRQSYTFSDFLAVPTASSSTPSQWTPSNWLTEHANIQGQLRTARSALLKRDALAGMGDAPGSRGAGVEAKKLLREVGDKIGVLDKGLGVIGKAIGEGERKRREEMVEGLRNERGDLQRMAEAGVRTMRDVSGASTANSGFGTGSSGGSGLMPGAMPTFAAPGRVFGKQPPQETAETAETRPLDERGLLQLQQVKMDNQDGQLEELSKILRRQKDMGEEIHREIGEQTEMLEDIEGEVGRVGGKMARAKRQMNKLG